MDELTHCYDVDGIVKICWHHILVYVLGGRVAQTYALRGS